MYGDSCIMDITVRKDFLGPCDKNKLDINMRPILNNCGVMVAWILEQTVRIIEN